MERRAIVSSANRWIFAGFAAVIFAFASSGCIFKTPPEPELDTGLAEADGTDSPDTESDPTADTTTDADSCTETNDGVEICDGKDNDCDGEVDEEAQDRQEFFEDSDGDGYGNPDSSELACEQPDGYVDNDEDCDDSDPDINPDGTEVCDGKDNDCDGEVDESDAEDATTWYEDGDGDGYGNPDSSREACDQPDGFVEDNTDCDDTNSNVHPMAEEKCNGIDNNCDETTDNPTDSTCECEDGATQDCGTSAGICETGTQTCNGGSWGSCQDQKTGGAESCDGKDNDCDGKVDEGKPSDAPTWYKDFDGDGYGDPDNSYVACDKPTPETSWVSNDEDCDDGDPDINPDATEVCDGVDNNCSGDVDDVANGTCNCQPGDTQPCGKSTGACQKGTRECVSDGSGGTEWSSCRGNIEPSTEVCDNVDNDCDGLTDENNFSSVHIGGPQGTTCALTRSGPNDTRLFCWGRNNKGQLGDGTTQNRDAPVEVNGSNQKDFKQVDIGYAHTCGTTHDDKVFCWGENLFGQLGDGTTTQRNTPTKVDVSYSTVYKVSAGGRHTCVSYYFPGTTGAIKLPPENSIECWGENGSGALGIGSSGGQETSPKEVDHPVGVELTAPTGGWQSSCSIATDDKAWCWGGNWNGQAGIGNTTNQHSPQEVTGGHDFQQIESSADDTVCALTNGGQAYCWGDGREGQIGDGSQQKRQNPTKVQQGSVSFQDIAVAKRWVCALSTSNEVYCWGDPDTTQLGPNVSDSDTPIKIQEGGTALKYENLEAGNNHMCGKVVGNGNIECWGKNQYGELGNGTASNASSPERVSCVRP